MNGYADGYVNGAGRKDNSFRPAPFTYAVPYPAKPYSGG